MKYPSHLRLVSNNSDPMALLNHLMMALCESYNLELNTTSKKLYDLIIELCREVSQKNIDNHEFQTMADFITSIMHSDERTIDEFLRYVEAIDP